MDIDGLNQTLALFIALLLALLLLAYSQNSLE